ncbi:MAG: AAC(3) family N-acetyltransferase [Erysipelotrichaceae bacterium]|nr:AAC(3) family N-acetyltransferase [Erysipelotrichaceae bacterium]
MSFQSNETITAAFSRDELVSQFKALGVKEGTVLEVHSSLKSLGYVIGGAQSVVDALRECVGPEGTLVMSGQNSNNTEPVFWENPPIERSLFQKVRDHMPATIGHGSDLFWMGEIARNLAMRDEAVWSGHPNCAFYGLGAKAQYLMENQSLDFALGEDSPLGRMYAEGAMVLLIGVGYDSCTSLHLAESRSGVRTVMVQGAALEEDGERVWKKYLDINYDSDEFPEIGEKLEAAGLVTTGQVGEADCKLFSLSEAVDLGQEYLKRKHL